jgi:hypothetical protein
MAGGREASTSACVDMCEARGGTDGEQPAEGDSAIKLRHPFSTSLFQLNQLTPAVTSSLAGRQPFASEHLHPANPGDSPRAKPKL